MSVSPAFAASLAEEVARIYEGAELRILEVLVEVLSKGVNDPWWERDVLKRLQTIRPQVLAVLKDVNPAAADAIRAAFEEAYSVGMLAAFAEVGTEAIPVAHTSAVTALATATLGKTAEAGPFILRAAEDAARTVVAEVLRGTVTGTTLKQDALQRALNGLVREGFSTVPVGRGKMSAADYARMAVRTGTAQAMIGGHSMALQDLGLDLVTINPGPRACKTCDEWAGKVLTQGGTPVGEQTVEGNGREPLVVVKVDGTLAQARAAGCFHPNCRCSIRAFIPGITERRDVTQRPKWDEKGYQAQQEERGIERGIRRAKEREAVAIQPKSLKDARRAVKENQARMRDHLDRHPFLKRQSAREQVLRAEDGAPTPAPTATVEARGIGPTNAEKIRNAEVMYGTDSPQHRAAKKRFR